MTKIESTTSPVVKSELDQHEKVALRAYFLWQERGSPIGSPEEDWLRAEQEFCCAGAGRSLKQAQLKYKLHGSPR